jgi:hypothetical protein
MMNQPVGFLQDLPSEVSHLIRSQLVAQYATVSAAGVPIDTPTALFTSADLLTLDIATGLAYPAKAERPRRNPRVGLLIERDAEQPVVCVAGLAAVRDADLQANLDRYMAETVLVGGKTAMTDWALTRQAVWYYARIFVCITPVHVRWWRNRAAMGEQPRSWRASPGAFQPVSDPAPMGQASTPPAWPQPPWPDQARAALERNASSHLTLLDPEGFPLPIGVREARACDWGFRLVVPAGTPWREGKATLSFGGAEIFVGTATAAGAETHLHVERALPVFPLVADVTEVLQPKPSTRATLMQRLEQEAARRGQAVPVMPQNPPQPTACALYRVRNAPTG